MYTRSKNPDSKTSKKSFKDDDYYYNDDDIVKAVKNSINDEKKKKIKTTTSEKEGNQTTARLKELSAPSTNDSDVQSDHNAEQEMKDPSGTIDKEDDNSDHTGMNDEDEDELDDNSDHTGMNDEDEDELDEIEEEDDDEEEEILQRNHNEMIEKKIEEVIDTIATNREQGNNCSDHDKEQMITITTVTSSEHETHNYDKKDEKNDSSMKKTTYTIPQLAFGLYKIPASIEGELCILQAIEAGYRHFDTASYYGNEQTLGKALKRSGIPREEFCIASKVWNDALVSTEPKAVIESVHESLQRLDFGTYFDIFMIHWPIPGYFIKAYHQLESLHKEGKIRMLGLSNFNPAEYEELVQDAKITVPPVINQFEISAIMYRPSLIQYFQKHKIIVSSSKSISRGEAFENKVVQTIAKEHSVSPAQVLLRWLFQQQDNRDSQEDQQLQHDQNIEDEYRKILIVAKTATPERMKENRNIFNFVLTKEEMDALNGLTSKEDISSRENLELYRKISILTTPAD